MAGSRREASPERQLDAFIDKYSPEVAAVARAAFAKMRRLLPGANVLVYDNYNALAIGFAPTERTSDAVFSIALYPRWVNFFFLKGKGLPDPDKLLRGAGNVVRSIVIEGAKTLDRPAVRRLMQLALERSGKPFGPKSGGRLEIRAVSKKQRPRRPPPAKGKPRVTYTTVRKLGLALDGVEESTSYGTPALKVRGKLMLRLKEDGETIALRTDFDERDVLLRLDPEAFFVTDHYRDYPWVLVRLSKVAEKPLRDLIRGAWQRVVGSSRSR